MSALARRSAFALVTGLGPLPALGVAGAGWATLVTATAKALILALMAFGPRRVVRWSLPDDPAGWHSDATAEEIQFRPLPLKTMRYSNRPSGIQQVISFDGHRKDG